MTKKARLIYNPVSGHEQMGQNVADILDVMEDAGFEASAYKTKATPLSAQKEAHRAGLAGFDLIVGAGGDGTISEIVNGVASLEKRPQLAVIPAGTTNDFARALKIPRDDLVAAAKVILNGKKQKMDIGRAGDKYFMNIAASGSLTELTYGVPSELKSVLGYSAYLLKGAEMLPHISSRKVRITYDKGTYEGNMSMFLLGMTNSIGGFEQIMPDAQLSDGLFQLIVVKTANPIDVLRLMAMALSGKHIKDSQVVYTKTQDLKVELLDIDAKKQEIPVNLDGEVGGYLPIDFKNLKQHIEFYVG